MIDHGYIEIHIVRIVRHHSSAGANHFQCNPAAHLVAAKLHAKKVAVHINGVSSLNYRNASCSSMLRRRKSEIPNLQAGWWRDWGALHLKCGRHLEVVVVQVVSSPDRDFVGSRG